MAGCSAFTSGQLFFFAVREAHPPSILFFFTGTDGQRANEILRRRQTSCQMTVGTPGVSANRGGRGLYLVPPSAAQSRIMERFSARIAEYDALELNLIALVPTHACVLILGSQIVVPYSYDSYLYMYNKNKRGHTSSDVWPVSCLSRTFLRVLRPCHRPRLSLPLRRLLLRRGHLLQLQLPCPPCRRYRRPSCKQSLNPRSNLALSAPHLWRRRQCASLAMVVCGNVHSSCKPRLSSSGAVPAAGQNSPAAARPTDLHPVSEH